MPIENNNNPPQQPGDGEQEPDLLEIEGTVIFPGAEKELPTFPEFAAITTPTTAEMSALQPTMTRVDLDEVLTRPEENAVDFYRNANLHLDTVVLLPGHTEELNNLEVGILQPEDVHNVEGDYVAALPATLVITRLTNILDADMRTTTATQLLEIFRFQAKQRDLVDDLNIAEQMGNMQFLRGLVNKIRQASAINAFLHQYRDAAKKDIRSLPGESSPAYQEIQAGLALSKWDEAIKLAEEKGYLL